MWKAEESREDVHQFIGVLPDKLMQEKTIFSRARADYNRLARLQHQLEPGKKLMV